MNTAKIKQVVVEVIRLLEQRNFEVAASIAPETLPAEHLKEAVEDYEDATGMILGVAPDNFSDTVDVGDENWAVYVLPLWFDGMESDLMLETSITEKNNELEIMIKGILVK